MQKRAFWNRVSLAKAVDSLDPAAAPYKARHVPLFLLGAHNYSGLGVPIRKIVRFDILKEGTAYCHLIR